MFKIICVSDCKASRHEVDHLVSYMHISFPCLEIVNTDLTDNASLLNHIALLFMFAFKCDFLFLYHVQILLLPFTRIFFCTCHLLCQNEEVWILPSYCIDPFNCILKE